MAPERESRRQAMGEGMEPEGKFSPSAAAQPAEQDKAKPRLQPVNRQQMGWRTVDVERLIEEDHPARAIGELVGTLDSRAFPQDIGSVEGVGGRPALDPQLLISLWIYASSDAVSSARDRNLTGEARRAPRQARSKSILEDIHAYLEREQSPVLPKSPEAQAIAYTLSN